MENNQIEKLNLAMEIKSEAEWCITFFNREIESAEEKLKEVNTQLEELEWRKKYLEREIKSYNLKLQINKISLNFINNSINQ